MHSRARSSWMLARSTFLRICSTALPTSLLPIHLSLGQPGIFVQRNRTEIIKNVCVGCRWASGNHLPGQLTPRIIEKICEGPSTRAVRRPQCVSSHVKVRKASPWSACRPHRPGRVSCWVRLRSHGGRQHHAYQKPYIAGSCSLRNNQLKAKLLRPFGQQSDLLLAMLGLRSIRCLCRRTAFRV